ncbi:MAG: serine/threonine-protein kinase [Deltaproteobacteria bacterium]|nr:serine/threonine-protein kinase [Deltaproteobacteria bacterium]
MTADLDRWNRLAPLVDELLDLEPAQRVLRLEELGRGDFALRMALEDLLDSHHEEQDTSPRTGTSVSGDSPAGDSHPDPGEEDATDPRLGSVIGGYRLLQRLGEGGMATVYLGERQDAAFDHPVAIKLVRMDRADSAMVERFRDEQRILASLSHPSIARLFDGGAASDGQPYIVMEVVEGLPLDRYCDANELDLEARLRLFCQVCEAIEYAHGKLVVHRDLKPSNILVSAEGEVKILDFGVAKLLEPMDQAGARDDLTSLFGVPLTPAYAAPEQLDGEGVTTATDVYSLGLVLYELLTGLRALARSGRTPLEQTRKKLERDPQRPSQRLLTTAGESDDPKTTELPPEERSRLRSTTVSKLVRRLQGDLDTIVLKALRHQPERRYGSVEALRDDLQRYLAQMPIRARPESWSYNLDRFVRRHFKAVAAGILVATSLLGALGVAIAGWDQARREAEISDRLSRFLVETFRTPDPTTHRPGGQISATELLTQAAERIQQDRQADPEVRARLAEAIGESFLGIGDYQRADENVAESVRLWGESRGEFAPETVATKSLQGRIWATMGRLREAEELYEELWVELAQHPKEKALRARVANDFGVLLSEKSDFERSEEFYREAMSLRRKLGDLESQHGIRLRNNLAVSLRGQGELEEAEDLLRGVLRSLRIRLSEPHADIATCVNNLARVVRGQGELDEAEGLYREALEQRRAVFGEVHPDTAQSYNNIGAIRYLNQDIDGAAEYFEKAFQIWDEFFEGDHPRICDSLNNIAALRRKQGRFDEAEQAFERALGMTERLNHPDHPKVALVLRRWGDLRLEEVGAAAAIPLLERALVILETTQGLDSEASVKTVLPLIKAYRGVGRPEAAATLLARVETAAAAQPEVLELLSEARAEAAATSG